MSRPPAQPERTPPNGPVAVVLKGYPRLSETFIAQELRALERRGLQLRIVALRRPTDAERHPIHAEIAAPVSYLPEYAGDAPKRIVAAWRRVRRLPGYPLARRAFLADLRREPTRNRARRFAQACVLAAELPADVRRLYVHFLHTPASVARYAALMTGLPWSASAHAKDIWITPAWDLRQKLADSDWTVTCTAHGRDRLAALAPSPAKVGLVYHGLDLARLPAPATPATSGGRDGADPGDPVRLLAVGRAVEKKGLDLLLDALARLPAELHWRLTHIGGGALAGDLRRQADRLGVADRIDWRGPQAHAAVAAAYAQADLFVLPCRIAADGDRDGLPNVLMEAQSQALACVSTTVSAIPELIRDGATGRLVPPGDVDALVALLDQLIRDPAQRARLGAAGAAHVRRAFDMTAHIDALAARFGLPPLHQAPPRHEAPPSHETPIPPTRRAG